MEALISIFDANLKGIKGFSYEVWRAFRLCESGSPLKFTPFFLKNYD